MRRTREQRYIKLPLSNFICKFLAYVSSAEGKHRTNRFIFFRCASNNSGHVDYVFDAFQINNYRLCTWQWCIDFRSKKNVDKNFRVHNEFDFLDIVQKLLSFDIVNAKLYLIFVSKCFLFVRLG